MRALALLPLLLAATPLSAEGFRHRPGDTVLDAAAMAALVVGQTHTFHDDGRSVFGPSGRYSYTYASGGTAYGRYELRDDGVVCTFFDHGFSRCDRYVTNGSRMLLLTEEGERFPLRANTAWD